MARKHDDTGDQPAEPADDPTRGGALPDPADQSARGRFNRGEITLAQLSDELDAEAD